MKPGEFVEVSFTGRLVLMSIDGISAWVQVPLANGLYEKFHVPAASLTLASDADKAAKGGA